MRSEDLLKGLNADNPNIRLRAAWMIGMLEETKVLNELGGYYVSETDKRVKRAISEAGERLQHARSVGYDTIDSICQHFKIDREISSMVSDKEADMIRFMEVNMNKGNKPSGGMSGAMVGAAIGGMMLGAGGMLTGAMTAMNAQNIRVSDQPLYNALGNRDMPVTPTNRDIQTQMKILMESPDAKARQQAIFDTIGTQNPAALPYLATAFYNDTDENVRQTAEKIGKRIYWNAVYFTLEKEGDIIDIMRQRAIAAGKIKPEDEEEQPIQQAAPPPPKQESRKPTGKLKLSTLLTKAAEEESSEDE